MTITHKPRSVFIGYDDAVRPSATNEAGNWIDDDLDTEDQEFPFEMLQKILEHGIGPVVRDLKDWARRLEAKIEKSIVHILEYDGETYFCGQALDLYALDVEDMASLEFIQKKATCAACLEAYKVYLADLDEPEPEPENS